MRKGIQWLRILLFRSFSTARFQGSQLFFQPLQTVGSGQLMFLGEVNIGFFSSPLFFSTYAYLEARNSTAKISIGDGTWINNGFSAIAEHTSITIGQRVRVGTSVEIFDSDFHGSVLMIEGSQKRTGLNRY